MCKCAFVIIGSCRVFNKDPTVGDIATAYILILSLRILGRVKINK